MEAMEISRRQAVADALGSVRAEELEPGPRAEARKRVAGGESIEDLLGFTWPPGSGGRR